MEALYLLLSIASTAATSSLLSLALALRSLVSLLLPHLSSYSSSPPPPSAADEGGAAEEISPPPIRLYEGRVRHQRRRPVAHAFDYRVRYALVDLDRAPRLISSSSSHLHPDRAREVAGSNGSVYLLTMPESVGYEQNPLSIYYCYDLEEEKENGGGDARRCSIRLKMCIAEVTNTPWGEKVFFTFRPGSDLVAKPLHALRLWLKNIKFLGHPKFRNPNYRAEALLRDQELSCNRNSHNSNSTSSEGDEKRWCVWRDAQWPWS